MITSFTTLLTKLKYETGDKRRRGNGYLPT